MSLTVGRISSAIAFATSLRNLHSIKQLVEALGNNALHSHCSYGFLGRGTVAKIRDVMGHLPIDADDELQKTLDDAASLDSEENNRNEDEASGTRSLPLSQVCHILRLRLGGRV